VTGETKKICKVRGITLNYKASQLVNFETIKNLILNGRSNSTVTVHTDKKIKRKTIDGACVSIVTEPEDKIYKYPFSRSVGETIIRPYPSAIRKFKFHEYYLIVNRIGRIPLI